MVFQLYRSVHSIRKHDLNIDLHNVSCVHVLVIARGADTEVHTLYIIGLLIYIRRTAKIHFVHLAT